MISSHLKNKLGAANMPSLSVTLTIALFVLFTFFNCLQAAHILGLFVNEIRSHLLVYSGVVRVLLERGHKFTLVTTLPLEDEFLTENKNLIRHIQLTTSYTNRTQVAHSDPFEKLQRTLFLIEQTSRFLEDPIWLDFLREAPRFDLLLLGYHFNDYQLGVAAHFGCPVVLIWTGQPVSYVHSLLGSTEFRWHVPQPYDRHERRGLSAWVFGAWEKSTELMARRVMRSIYNKNFPTPKYPDFDAVRRNVSLALCNHHSLSESPIAPHVPAIVEVGGIQISTQPAHQNITGERDLIFFSLGTRVSWSNVSPNVAQAFRTVFHKLKSYDILWTHEDARCGEIHAAAAAAHIHCSSWWPQSRILSDRRTKLFITHGGKASLTEALHYGVPILGLPLFGDQRGNVAKAVRRGRGLTLDFHTLTSDSLYSAILELLQNESFAAQAVQLSRIYHDRPLNASATVAYWVDYVLRYKGARHIQSPAIHLNFWQHNSLDVLAFIIFCFISICQCLKWLERRLDQ